MICTDCDYRGRPTYDFPCSRCDMTMGSPFCCYEHEEKPTNADYIRSMSDEELARWISGGAMESDSACSYCEHNKNKTCDGTQCQGVTDVEIIMKWLKKPMEG